MHRMMTLLMGARGRWPVPVTTIIKAPFSHARHEGTRRLQCDGLDRRRTTRLLLKQGDENGYLIGRHTRAMGHFILAWLRSRIRFLGSASLIPFPALSKSIKTKETD